jgi:putative SOS response-associated peptidase YedK
MCGRYSLIIGMEQLVIRFGIGRVEAELVPRYNVAPTQIMPVVVGQEGKRELRMMQWGLVPFWAKDKTIGSRLINARVETVAEKPAFKYALRQRRCIIPADGYYEWQKTGAGKQAMRIVRPDREPFGLAGLWEQWRDPAGDPLFTYTILTTSPTAPVKHIHDRMPLVLNPEQEGYWLDGLLGTTPSEIGSFINNLWSPPELTSYPVSNLVNTPRNDDPLCIAPA